jgi:hypothetical protein
MVSNALSRDFGAGGVYGTMVGILRGRVIHLEVTADEECARHLDCLGDWNVGLEKRGIGRVSKSEAGGEEETRRKNDENKRETAGLLNAGGRKSCR